MRNLGLFFCFCLFWLPLKGENITVFGIGKLGICQALCYEKAGHNVLGVDLSEEYVHQINSKIFCSNEPQVVELLIASKNFSATTSIKKGIEFSDIYIIAVPTNSIPGQATYDHTILSNLISKINSHSVSNKHIVIASTIFPGYTRNIAKPLIRDCTNTTISYNPAFIAQGDIIHGFLNPDIILIGEGSAEIGTILSNIYKNMTSPSSYIARMSVDSAEITKLALNCFITAKIAFANLIGDVADETPEADKVAILTAIGKDRRIGSLCLQAGYGYGGPCFPRDNRAFGEYASSKGIDPSFFTATEKSNIQHADHMTKKFLEMDLSEYLFDDVCYKSKCPVPIIEESQKLEVAKKIALKGKLVVIKDRKEVILKVQEAYGNLFEYIEQ